VALAAVWPVFLFIAVEILVRIVWPAGKVWLVLRFGGLTPVAGVAALVSYRHLSGLLAHIGEEDLVVLAGPIAVDGLMLMSTCALIAINHRARAAALPATVAAAAVPVAVPSVPVAPAVTAPAAVAAPVAAVAVPVHVAVAPPVPATVERPMPAASPSTVVSTPVVSSPVNSGESTMSVRAVKPPVPAAAPSRANTLVPAPGAAVTPVSPVPVALLARAKEIAKAHLATNGVPITAGELAVRLRVASAMSIQIVAALDLLPDSPTKPAAALNGSAVTATR
jgi:hypothetical protein